MHARPIAAGECRSITPCEFVVFNMTVPVWPCAAAGSLPVALQRPAASEAVMHVGDSHFRCICHKPGSVGRRCRQTAHSAPFALSAMSCRRDCIQNAILWILALSRPGCGRVTF
jgi:hypothetical protein